MVRRAKTTAKKKPAKRVVKKKKASSPRKKTVAKTSDSRAVSINKKAQWVAYKELQNQVDKAWARLKTDVKNKANPQVLIRDKNELLLLLGECNYMASECMRLAKKKRN